MALDTAQKRGSVIGLSSPWRPWLAVADGTLAATDRLSIIYHASAVTPGDPVEPPPEPPPSTQKRGFAGPSRFVEARRRINRLPLQRVLDYLTEDDPAPETRRIIREVRAGKPVPQDDRPPVVMREVSAERIADQLIPSRLLAIQSLAAQERINLQAVIRKAIEIAQDRDDEDVLLLL